MISSKIISKFKDEGVIKFKKFISKKKANEIEKKLNEYIKKNKSKLYGKDINYINGEVNSLHKSKEIILLNFVQVKR